MTALSSTPNSISISTSFPDKTSPIHYSPTDEHANQNPTDNESSNPDPEGAQPLAYPELNPPPDGGYGWVCVVCVFLVNAHTWGINSVGFVASMRCLYN